MDLRKQVLYALVSVITVKKIINILIQDASTKCLKDLDWENYDGSPFLNYKIFLKLNLTAIAIMILMGSFPVVRF